MSEAEKDDTPIRVVDRRWWARGEGSAEAEAVRKPTVVEDLEQRLADTTAHLQQVMSEYRRSSDEFEQAKARIRREVGRDVERARRAVLTELLEVMDNLDRAVAAAREPGASQAVDAVDRLVRGVELVRDQFLAKLDAWGVTRVPALNQPFDAARHEAVTTVTVADAGRDGHVVAVLKEGYAVGDEVLRPASVVVAQTGRD